MSLVRKPVIIRNLESGQSLTVTALVDSGATLMALPQRAAQQLGLRSVERRRFELADRSILEFDVANVGVTLAGWSGATMCAFGESIAEPLIGVTTLETLFLALDPVREELVPVDGLMRGLR